MNNCLTGKENVYINTGIDKVPIITLEETGSQGESGPTPTEAPARPELPAKISTPYENTRVHEMAIKELMYVVTENSKDNNRQLKEQFKVRTRYLLNRQLKKAVQDKNSLHA